MFSNLARKVTIMTETEYHKVRAAIAQAEGVERCEVCEHTAAEVGPMSTNERHATICDDCLDD
jgi:hypothetical protein